MGAIGWTRNFLTVTRQPNFKTVSRIASLLVAVLLGTTPVQAGVFTFVYSNFSGPVSGTVSGTITLPDGDGIFTASSIIVGSAPAALGYTTPINVTNYSTITNNYFVVSGGQIVKASSTFVASTAVDAFGVGASGYGSFLTMKGSPGSPSAAFSGVVDTSSVTLTYASAPAAVPEPTSLAILGLGALGVAYRARRKSSM